MSDYIIYNRPAPDQVAGARPSRAAQDGKVYPMTPGLWQKETLETLEMYGAAEGGFSSVQLSLFPDMVAPQATAEVGAVDLDQPEQPIPHWNNFRFMSKDTLRYALQPTATAYAGAVPTPATGPVREADLHDPSKTEIKNDHFPGRVYYTKGGLYPENSPAMHQDAPNYRQVKDKPVHGVGQPTKKGFQDIMKHLNAKTKPVAWTNTRAEAVIYINGKPYNLRKLASMENMTLKEGASGAELEALEAKLKQQLLAKPQPITLSAEVEGPGGKPVQATETVTLTPENTQTTREVIDELRSEGYKVEYRRIPVEDERSPHPSQLDEMRQFMNEVQAKHPDQDLQYVYNCHQGRGRTTTGMVAAGIALDGRVLQLELPFMENARERADRIVDDTYHMLNLRDTVKETEKKADEKARQAEQLRTQAAAEQDAKKREELETKAREAQEKSDDYRRRGPEFTKRYAMMQLYSEYIGQFGAQAETPSFDDWMKRPENQSALDKQWLALNQQCGLTALPQTALA